MSTRENGVNKSEEIRRVLKSNPNIGTKEALAQLSEKGIKVSNALFHFVKGHVKGRTARKKRADNAIATVSEFRHSNRLDAVSTILKVKGWAKEVGGMKNLKALVEALCD